MAIYETLPVQPINFEDLGDVPLCRRLSRPLPDDLEQLTRGAVGQCHLYHDFVSGASGVRT